MSALFLKMPIPRKKIFSRALVKEVWGHVLLITVGLFFAVPFLWMLLTAFKSDEDVFRIPPRWLPYAKVRVEVNGKKLPLYKVKTETGVQELALLQKQEGVGIFLDPRNPSQEFKIPFRQDGENIAEPIEHISFRWQNFPEAMRHGARSSVGANFWVYFRNSLVIAFFSVAGTLVSNAPVAYAFARLKFPGREVLFLLVLATMMLPFQATMIPLYLLFNNFLKWNDTFLPLIVPTFFASAYEVFLMRQFFRSIPEEMCDAARVDGANEWIIFTRIVLPLSTPVLTTVAVFNFLWSWNDFAAPLLFLNSPRNYTLALGLQDFQGQHTMVWNQMMAAAVVFTIPIIVAFFFAQKTFIQGIKMTGMKD